jgi:hypothetical protein
VVRVGERGHDLPASIEERLMGMALDGGAFNGVVVNALPLWVRNNADAVVEHVILIGDDCLLED